MGGWQKRHPTPVQTSKQNFYVCGWRWVTGRGSGRWGVGGGGGVRWGGGHWVSNHVQWPSFRPRSSRWLCETQTSVLCVSDWPPPPPHSGAYSPPPPAPPIPSHPSLSAALTVQFKFNAASASTETELTCVRTVWDGGAQDGDLTVQSSSNVSPATSTVTQPLRLWQCVFTLGNRLITRLSIENCVCVCVCVCSVRGVRGGGGGAGGRRR